MHLIYLSFQETFDKLLIQKIFGFYFFLILSRTGVTDMAD